MYFDIPIESIDRTIDEAILYSIAQDLDRYLGLSAIDKLKIVKDDEIQKTDGDQRLLDTVYLKATYDSDYTDPVADSSTASPLMSGDFNIIPNYNVRNFKLTFTAYGKSRTTIGAVRNKLRQAMLFKSNTLIHDIIYRYYLDGRVYQVIEYMYKLRKHQGCFSGTLEDYINNLIQDNRTTLTSDPVGNKLNITFKEQQHGLVGQFHTTELTKDIEYSKDRGLYSFEFDYSIYISLPFEFLISYKNALGANVLPSKYITSMHEAPSEKLTWLSSMIDEITKDANKDIPKLHTDVIHIPASDHFDFKTMTGITDIFTVLVSSDDNNILFNLKELGDVHLSDKIIKFLEDSEYQHVTKYGDSPLYIYGYKGDKLLPLDFLTVDSELNVIAKEPLDKCISYHIIFGIYPDYIRRYIDIHIGDYPWLNVRYEVITPLDLDGSEMPYHGIPHTTYLSHTPTPVVDVINYTYDSFDHTHGTAPANPGDNPDGDNNGNGDGGDGGDNGSNPGNGTGNGSNPGNGTGNGSNPGNGDGNGDGGSTTNPIPFTGPGENPDDVRDPTWLIPVLNIDPIEVLYQRLRDPARTVQISSIVALLRSN